LLAFVLAAVVGADEPRALEPVLGVETLRGPDPLKVGDAAPDFTLRSPLGTPEMTLSQFRGKRPVALIFGSYT
jgi:hypothetical protein